MAKGTGPGPGRKQCPKCERYYASSREKCANCESPGPAAEEGPTANPPEAPRRVRLAG